MAILVVSKFCKLRELGAIIMVNPIQRTISSVSVMLAFEVLQVAREFRHIFWKQDYMK